MIEVMNTDELKLLWEENSRRLSQLEDDMDSMVRNARDGRRRTALDNLIAYYRRFSMLAFACALMCSVYLKVTYLPEEIRIMIAVWGVVYFLTAGIMDRWLMKQLEKINIYTMSFSEVVKRVINCRKKHHLFMLILLPMAVCLVGGMAFFSTNEILVWGIWAGILVGCIIGARAYYKIMFQYKELLRDE